MCGSFKSFEGFCLEQPFGLPFYGKKMGVAPLESRVWVLSLGRIALYESTWMNLYPTPETVCIYLGEEGFSSILVLRCWIWTSITRDQE